MDLQLLATSLTGLGVLIALAAFLLTMKRDLKASIDGVKTGLGERIDKVEASVTTTRTELGERIDKAEAKIDDTLTEMRNEHRSDLSDIRAGLRALEQRFFEILLPRHPAPTGTDEI